MRSELSVLRYSTPLKIHSSGSGVAKDDSPVRKLDDCEDVSSIIDASKDCESVIVIAIQQKKDDDREQRKQQHHCLRSTA